MENCFGLYNFDYHWPFQQQCLPCSYYLGWVFPELQLKFNFVVQTFHILSTKP